MTVARILKATRERIPPNDANVLLCHVLGCDKEYLFINDGENVSEENETRFFALVERRVRHEPVQYIVNRCEFMSLSFYVDENVLIPRPDTETLVELLIDTTTRGRPLLGLDLCTGSGCIAVSVARLRPDIMMTAADISAEALRVAQRNAAANNVSERITFVQSDLFNSLPVTKYDFIVSNPPYIETSAIDTLEPNVRDYEPHAALDGGNDGLMFYRRITRECMPYLKRGAAVYFEIGCSQAESAARIIREAGLTDISVIKDLAGLDRVIWAKNGT
jgi:release factor glutamine methyltransferase